MWVFGVEIDPGVAPSGGYFDYLGYFGYFRGFLKCSVLELEMSVESMFRRRLLIFAFVLEFLGFAFG